MKRTTIVVLVALSAIIVMPAIRAADVAIGNTVELYDPPDGAPTRGVLVAENELAPCGSTSRANDIHFSPKKVKIVRSNRPCPGLPKVIGSKTVHIYLAGRGSLPEILQSQLPNATFTAKP